MTRKELIDHLQHLEQYTHYSEDAPALREVIEMLKCSEMPNGSDTISRQAAIDALHMHLMYRMGTDSNKKRLDDWINSLPSAQPEITRCKDCKYGSKDDEGRWYCLDLGYTMGSDDGSGFCSDAERRTNE